MAITLAKFGSDANGTGHASYSPSVNPSIGVTYGNNFNGITVNRTSNNTAYTFEKFGKKLGWKINYTHLSTADKAKLEVLFAYTKGRLNNFFFAENGSDYDYKVRFLKDKFNFREVAVGIFSISLAFEQD